MHELLASLILLADGNSPSSPAPSGASATQIALITAFSVIAAALITAAATWFQRRREAQQGDPSQGLIEELQRRAVTAETQGTSLEARNQSLSERVDELEGFCWRNGIDPSTGDPIPQHPVPGGDQ